MRIISTVVLLAAIAVCNGHELGEVYNLPYSSRACEDRQVYMNCPEGYYISVKTAFYGRDNIYTCADDLPENSTKVTSLTCNVTDALERIREQCDNQTDCYLETGQEDLDPDFQCDEVFKHLNITFDCVLPVYEALSCDLTLLTINCQGDSVLTILDAFYGRKDLTTCGESDVTSFDASCDSDYAKSAVSVLCNGKQSCDIHVSEGLLGQECGGDYKYLEVAYACSACDNEFGNDDACAGWAQIGECDANTAWMVAFCRQSCFGCKYTDLCENMVSDGDCDYWASIGECEINSNFMTENCRKSCNRCGQLLEILPGKLSPETKEVCEGDAVILHCEENYVVRIDSAFYGRGHNDTCANESVTSLNCQSPPDVVAKLRETCEGRQNCWFEPVNAIYGDPCPGNSKMGSVEYTCQRCYNAFVDGECEMKAQLGECESNREWMMDHCYRTCTQCYTAVDCYNTFDNDVDCDFWSLTGHCQSNSGWMSRNCEESCHTCDIFEPQFSDSLYEVICESGQRFLTCDTEGTYISVDHVFFGRDDIDTCPHELGNVTDCAGARGATEMVGNICGGRENCSFEARPMSWGDPCVGVYKLARVKYHCQACENVHSDELCEVKALHGLCETDYHFMQEHCFKTCSKCDQTMCGNSHTSTVDCDFWGMRGECNGANADWMSRNCAETCGFCPECNGTTCFVEPTTIMPDKTDVITLETCESGILHVTCDSGYRIWIEDMFFGRNSVSTCPDGADNTTDCEATNSRDLVTRCNGKEECYISANHEVFGDPCEGTSKHARVDYICHTCANILDDSACEYKESQGECESNYEAMMRDCFQTCSHCNERDCVNTHNSSEDCDRWAMQGECEINSDWMTEQCALSCNTCGIVPTGTPPPDTDKQNPVYLETCENAAVNLNCSDDYVIRLDLIFFGRHRTDVCPHEDVTGEENCASPPGLFEGLMNLCNGRPDCWYEPRVQIWGDSCPGVHKHAHVMYTCQKCVDVLETSSCETMRDENKCNTDYSYMMDHCFKTCSQCHESGCGNTYGTPVDCDFWAATNNCQTNPGFMYENCQESCRVCVDMTCPVGFKGDGCTENDCSLVNDCNGQGECTGPNECTCNTGYHGDDCSDFRCDGVNECSNNGRCYGPNQCFCYPYFSGDDCGECSVAFQAGPNCMPCPECIHGTCVQEDDLPLGPAVDMTPNKDGGTYKQIQREGVGTATPQPGDTIFTHYHGTLIDGSVFDASRPRQNMFIFKIGTAYAIRGWEVALPTMKKGEIATLTIRSDYAYGSDGLGSSIPPGATLIIRVELWDFKNTCSDVFDRNYCLDQQAAGACESDFERMNLNCERTCGFCGQPNPIPETCTNGYESQQDCEYWAGIGECVLNPEWMYRWCNKSCNGCGDQCTNAQTEDAKDEDCDYWTKIGECDLDNAAWMRRNCPKSCGFCDKDLPDTETCKNEHESDVNCDYWARTGECDEPASQPWMHINCRKSCGLCEGIKGPNTKSHLGCYADMSSGRDLEHSAWTGSDQTSTFECMQRCYALDYKYAATQNGDSCYCGNTYGRYGEAPGRCDVPCSGASGDICGGDDANSVWAVYEGTCECEDGWTGSQCDSFSNTTSTTTTSTTTTSTTTSSTTTASTTTTPTTTTSTTSTSISTDVSSTITPMMQSSTFRPTTTTESSTISTTTTSTTPTTKITDRATTVTERSTAAPSTTTASSNEVLREVEVVVIGEWQAEYNDLQNPTTIFFLEEVKRNLQAYYGELLGGVAEIIIIELRQGSVIVVHDIVLDHSMNDAEQEDNLCKIYENIYNDRDIGDIEITSSNSLEKECKWRRYYCKNDGELYRSKNGNWKCDCKDGATGDKCEDMPLTTLQIVLIAVACCVVLLLVIAITCAVIHRRNHRKMERLKSERRAAAMAHFPQPNNDTNSQFQGKSKGTFRSATKLFRGSRDNEMADTEGFFPSQI